MKSKNNTCSYLMRSSVVNWGVVLPWRTSFWSWSVWFRAKMTCMQDHAIVQRKKQVHKLKVSNKGEKGEPGHTWGRLEAGTALPPSPQRPPRSSLKELLWSFREMKEPFSSAWPPSEPSRGPRQGNLCLRCRPSSTHWPSASPTLGAFAPSSQWLHYKRNIWALTWIIVSAKYECFTTPLKWSLNEVVLVFVS